MNLTRKLILVTILCFICTSGQSAPIRTSPIRTSNVNVKADLHLEAAPPSENLHKQFFFKPRGRIHLDAGAGKSRSSESSGNFKGTEIRRARLGVDGRVAQDFTYSIELEFAGERVLFQDVTLGYVTSRTTQWTLGYHKPPITLDDQTSDNHITFLERAIYSTTFSPGRGVGASLTHLYIHGIVTAGIWGGPEANTHTGQSDEDWIFAARGTLLPVNQSTGLLHLAASTYYMKAGTGEPRFRLSDRPEIHLSQPVIDTGHLDIRHTHFIGLEALLIKGPLHLTGEWGAQNISRRDRGSLRFKGGYAQIGWFLTGEQKAYNHQNGTFGRIIPKRAMNDDGTGAIEFAVRHSRVDLNSNDIKGGAHRSWTAGINWYPNAYVRFMLNYVRFGVKDRPYPDQKGEAIGLRGQIDW